jgi:hypothetical protein
MHTHEQPGGSQAVLAFQHMTMPVLAFWKGEVECDTWQAGVCGLSRKVSWRLPCQSVQVLGIHMGPVHGTAQCKGASWRWSLPVCHTPAGVPVHGHCLPGLDVPPDWCHWGHDIRFVWTLQ